MLLDHLMHAVCAPMPLFSNCTTQVELGSHGQEALRRAPKRRCTGSSNSSSRRRSTGMMQIEYGQSPLLKVCIKMSG